MFAGLTVGIFRRWQADRKIVALLLQSHGKHTEACVLRDDSGSAYQITFHASGLHFRPTLTLSEYLPESMRVLHQRSFFTTPFTLRRDLDRSLDQVHAWMKENKSERLPQDEEMKLVQACSQKTKSPTRRQSQRPRAAVAHLKRWAKKDEPPSPRV